MRARSHRAKAKSIGAILELDDVVVNRILLKSKQLCIIHMCMQMGKSHVYRTVTERGYLCQFIVVCLLAVQWNCIVIC